MPLRSVATLFLLLVLAARPAAAAPDAVNAAIGDASWLATYGRLPTSDDDEGARIATHLTYVLAQLRAATPLGQTRRTAALDALESYIARGQFPRRTDDHYAGRRPRFIDDRGVHCAVGQLIADTGSPELARAIDAEHEYAYVQDITTPGLAAWARATGFSVEELAMIQPGYSPPPRREATKIELEEQKDRITLACAAQHPALPELTVRVMGKKSGRAIVTTKSTDPFARCFVTHASKLETGGGAYEGSPEIYDFTMTLRLSSPQQLFENQLGTQLAPGCWPRPGELARQATVEAFTTPEGRTVNVDTSPINAEVGECIGKQIAHSLHLFGPGTWKLYAKRTYDLAPQVTTSRIQPLVRAATPRVVRECTSAAQRPANVKVSITARVDDAQFAITVPALPAAAASCVGTKLNENLRENLRMWRDAPGEHYMRIDTNVSISVTVELPR